MPDHNVRFTEDQLRDFARRAVEGAAREIDFGGIGEKFEDEWTYLSDAEFDQAREAVYDLAVKATLAVTWPAEEPADA